MLESEYTQSRRDHELYILFALEGRFHMLLLDGVYVSADGGPFSHRAKPPAAAKMKKLIHRISRRVGRNVERARLLARIEGARSPAVRWYQKWCRGPGKR